MRNNQRFFLKWSHFVLPAVKSIISQQNRLLDDLLNTNLVIIKIRKTAENRTEMYSNSM